MTVSGEDVGRNLSAYVFIFPRAETILNAIP